MYQGQTKQVTVPCVDENENPIDMTGATVTWRLYRDPSNEVGSALIFKSTALSGDDKITLTLINGATGELDAAVFKIVDVDTEDLLAGEYWHELHETDVLGNESPLAIGWVTVRPSPAGRA